MLGTLLTVVIILGIYYLFWGDSNNNDDDDNSDGELKEIDDDVIAYAIVNDMFDNDGVESD